MSATGIVSGAALTMLSTFTCGSYGLRFCIMLYAAVVLGNIAAENMSEVLMMMSLYNTVLNFLGMVMVFSSETLMFSFLFSSYMAINLSVVFCANCTNMGGGAMVITFILTALALALALLVTNTVVSFNFAFPKAWHEYLTTMYNRCNDWIVNTNRYEDWDMLLLLL